MNLGRCAAALLGCLCLLAGSEAVADWTQSTMACAELIAAQTSPRCGSCAALWPQISKCAADAEGVEPARADACISRVNNESWAKPLYFDRVGAVVSCLK